MKKEFPDKRIIIMFTGGPGTGKSGTAERFLKYLDNPDIVTVSYDKIKEKNWDRFGFDSVEQKDRLNAWSLEEMYLVIQNLMYKDSTILTEYPFYQRHKGELKKLIDEYQYSAATVYLYADKRTVYERAMRRDALSGRHPGHLLNVYHKETFRPEMLTSKDSIKPTFDEFFDAIRTKEYNINLGTDIPLDVTDFSKINYCALFEKIAAGQFTQLPDAK